MTFIIVLVVPKLSTTGSYLNVTSVRSNRIQWYQWTVTSIRTPMTKISPSDGLE